MQPTGFRQRKNQRERNLSHRVHGEHGEIMTVKPIEDEDLWGVPTGNKHADYWAFGYLPDRLKELADLNLIDWPLKSPWQWRDIELVKKAMADVFRRLPDSDKESIRGDYETFLRLDEWVDWVAMAEYKEPTGLIPGERWMMALEAIEDEKELTANGNK